MTRTSTSPIAATILLAVILGGVPAWLLVRFMQGPIAFQTLDIVLIGAAAVWAITVRALTKRPAALDPETMHSPTPMTLAHRLVDISVAGIGFAASAEQAPQQLHRLTQPQAVISDQLPEPMPHPHFARGLEAELAAREPAAVPVINGRDDDLPSFEHTNEYIVDRGDTFWSLSETFLGDGREWKQLQRLNLGRQVAPDTVLSESNEQLRIGWSIHVPIGQVAIDNEAPHSVSL